MSLIKIFLFNPNLKSLYSNETSFFQPSVIVYSTVTDLARFLGLSTSQPLATAQ